MTIKLQRIGCALLLQTIVTTALCAEVRLTNGVVLPGKLLRVEQNAIVWDADLLGEIKVPKSAIAAMESVSPAPLRIADGPVSLPDCQVKVNDNTSTLLCPGGTATAIQLADLRSTPATPSTSGKILTSLRLDRGPSPSDELRLEGNGKWLRDTHRHTVNLDVDYERDNHETVEDDANADYQFDWLREDGWYWLAKARYYRDKFEVIEEAYVVAGGIGRDFTPTADLKMSLQAGPSVAHYYIDDQPGSQTEPGSVFGWDLSWQTPWIFVLSHDGQFGWIFSGSDTYKFESKTAITYPIYQSLLLELSLNADYTGVSESGDGGDKDDIKWVMSLGYRW